jgi:ribulose-phosphate 3-epimerase
MSPDRIRVAPSLLAADFARLGDQVRRVADAGADMLHLDVMDGRFVPNISFGFPVIASVRRITTLPLDAHLMIEEPARYLAVCRDVGVDSVTVHLETHSDPTAVMEQCRQLGLGCGLVVSPATPIERFFPYVRAAALALVMSVEPGFGGQAFQPAALARIGRLRQRLADEGWQVPIQVDGGINLQTAPAVRAAGATVLVAGVAVFGSPDPAAVIRALRG